MLGIGRDYLWDGKVLSGHGINLLLAKKGQINVESGGEINIETGGKVKFAGTALDVTAPEMNVLVTGVAAGYKIARGQHTTVAASDTVVTGLNTVVAVVAVLDADPGVDPLLVTASIGNQSGAPAAGSVYIKSWKPTAVNDVTPIAATTFSKKVNWIAIGT